ncbi:MAG: phenylacetate--CoA ligase family protein [Proteobacteria bacterium]|nr:phenylacetate--CoA ligase family protein [Pseudomonadota bacterium]
MIDPLENRRRRQLARLIAYARQHSPYFSRLYQGLPSEVTDPTLLPVTSKKLLAPHFDDWVTDRSITLAEVRKFIGDPSLIGTPFRGEYTAATTSGSTGNPGIFLLDKHNRKAIERWGSRALFHWIGARGVLRFVLRGRRMATVSAVGAHFVVATSTTAIMRTRMGKGVRLFDAAMPMPQLVEQLNAFQPTILAGYAGLCSLLANEQEEGRLRLNPLLVMPGSEGMAIGEAERIATAFGAKLGTTYVATECLGIARSCKFGRLHYNSPFVILEPVDAQYQPVPPGVQSNTVLVTNLVNAIQPILRYDLGDSILVLPDRCPCGDRTPTIRVQGRTAELLRLGERAIAPLVLQTAVDRLPGIERFQIVQTAPTTLRLRLRVRAGHDPGSVRKQAEDGIRKVLAANTVSGVSIERSDEPPETIPGRKYRTVIPLS